MTKQWTAKKIEKKNRELTKVISQNLHRSPTKIKTIVRNSVLSDAVIDKDAFTPLTQLDRTKLANHLEELAFTVIDSLPAMKGFEPESSYDDDKETISRPKLRELVH